MKRILITLTLLISIAYGQTDTPYVNRANAIPMSANYNLKQNLLVGKNVLVEDTLRAKKGVMSIIRPFGDSSNFTATTAFVKRALNGITGSSFDTSYYFLYDLFLVGDSVFGKYSNTFTDVDRYAFKLTDTTGKFVNSVTFPNDSTAIVCKAGTCTSYSIKGGAGGGGSQTLQQTTHLGNVTDTPIIVKIPSGDTTTIDGSGVFVKNGTFITKMHNGAVYFTVPAGNGSISASGVDWQPLVGSPVSEGFPLDEDGTFLLQERFHRELTDSLDIIRDSINAHTGISGSYYTQSQIDSLFAAYLRTIGFVGNYIISLNDSTFTFDSTRMWHDADSIAIVKADSIWAARIANYYSKHQTDSVAIAKADSLYTVYLATLPKTLEGTITSSSTSITFTTLQNTTGYTWTATRVSDGNYLLTASGSPMPTASKTVVLVGAGDASIQAIVSGTRVDATQIQIISAQNAFSDGNFVPTDDILINTAVRVTIYP